MVKTSIQILHSRDFNHIVDLTKMFVMWANDAMDELDLDYSVEKTFLTKINTKVK